MTERAALGVGAWLKNRACWLSGGAVVWSPLHGDLSTPQACQALADSVEQWLSSATEPLHAIGHDLHPDFYSTQLAVDWAARRSVPAVAVQHHHAHIAAVVAEHRLDRPVIGLALDGVGLGTDGRAWGGELLWVHHAAWRRLGHLSSLPMPGGDRAAREPWRMASAVLHGLGRSAEIKARFSKDIGDQSLTHIAFMLSKDVQCPVTTSAGRWFDAAAASLGLMLRQDDEAQAAMAIERCALEYLESCEADTLIDAGLLERMLVAPDLDLYPLLEHLLDDPPGEFARSAAKFHVLFAEGLCEWAARAARRSDVHDVCLGGGCFFNRILLHRVRQGLTQRGFRVHWPVRSGAGDAGLALGQAWVAAHAASSTSVNCSVQQESICA